MVGAFVGVALGVATVALGGAVVGTAGCTAVGPAVGATAAGAQPEMSRAGPNEATSRLAVAMIAQVSKGIFMERSLSSVSHLARDRAPRATRREADAP
jgi:hypothetical protein